MLAVNSDVGSLMWFLRGQCLTHCHYLFTIIDTNPIADFVLLLMLFVCTGNSNDNSNSNSNEPSSIP